MRACCDVAAVEQVAVSHPSSSLNFILSGNLLLEYFRPKIQDMGLKIVLGRNVNVEHP